MQSQELYKTGHSKHQKADNKKSIEVATSIKRKKRSFENIIVGLSWIKPIKDNSIGIRDIFNLKYNI